MNPARNQFSHYFFLNQTMVNVQPYNIWLILFATHLAEIDHTKFIFVSILLPENSQNSTIVPQENPKHKHTTGSF